jgi:hypothetical protein
MSQIHASIYYQHDCIFKIIPIGSIIKKLSIPEQNLSPCWAYGIIVNQSSDMIDMTENDIFVQFSEIVQWLFDQGYSLSGSFYYRTLSTIEYIFLDGQSNVIIHYVLMDKLNLNDYLSGEYILDDAKIKINKYINKDTNTDTDTDTEDVNDVNEFVNTQQNINPSISKTKINIEFEICQNVEEISTNSLQPVTTQIIQEQYNVTNKSSIPSEFIEEIPATRPRRNSSSIIVNPEIIKQEEQIVIDSMQKRLSELENKVKSLTYVNKFFKKVFTMVGVFAVGSLYAVYTCSFLSSNQYGGNSM